MPLPSTTASSRRANVCGAALVALCLAVACLATAALAPQAAAADNVAGNLINFDNDGYWSWYMDERAIVDPASGKLLIGSVSGSPVRYPVGRPTGGVDATSFDLATGNRARTQLSDIDEDDHNAPGMIILPDGRYLAMYSNHGNASMGDYLSRYRISADQGATWSPEQSFNWQTVTGWNTAPNANNRVSYHNLYRLSADNGGQGRLYNFSRGTHQSANALVFNPASNTWSWGGQLTESATGGYSTGYVKYASNNVDKIYFISTETHPRNYNNNVYAGYISDGASYDMAGNVVDANLFNNDDTAGAGAVPDITSFTKIFQADPTGAGANPRHSNAWTVDLNLGPDGNPYGLFTTRWEEDDPLGNGSPYGDNEKDNNGFYHHTLWYAKYDGAAWHVNPVAKMGKLMYLSEEDYTGLGAIDPGNPNTVYISTPLDPRIPGDPPLTPGGPSASPSPTDFFWNPTYQVQDGQHEIYKGVTADNGQTWTWTPITQNSVVDNFRPIIPRWDADNRAVVWFRGTYTTAHNTDAAVVGIVERKGEQVGPVHYVDATTSNTTRASGAGDWDSGPSGAEAGNSATDNLWHWRLDAGNGGDVLASGATNTTQTENAPTLKMTLSGLEDGTYDIFAFFWANPAQDWRLQAGLAVNDLSLFRDNGAQQAEAAQFDPNDPAVVTALPNNAALYRAYVGRTEVAGGAAVDVFIDDFVTSTGAGGIPGANRTWFDGLGYALVTSTPMPGDFDGNGVVDGLDLAQWQEDFGVNGDSDADDDGDSDGDDFLVWQRNLGMGAEPPSQSSNAAVPEPSAGTLLLLGAALVRVARPKVRRRAWSGLVQSRPAEDLGRATRSQCRFALRRLLILVTLCSLTPAAPVAWAIGAGSYVSINAGPDRFALAIDGQPAPWFVSSEDFPGALRVAKLVQADVAAVVGAEPALSTGGESPMGAAVVLVGTLGKNPLIDGLVAAGKLDPRGLAGRWETFVIQSVDNPLPGIDRALVIAGSDKRGTIFGMFDLSAEIGVSPWHWWADVPVRKLPDLHVLPGRHTRGAPKVKYRGIFINDEAPALAGWMQEKFGGCNSKFYAHVFELILRLKGNYLWPAMWGRAIYDDDPESPRLADELGVVIGTSHHEPMMRAHVEWSRYGEGAWNYQTNEKRLRDFWREGVRRMGTHESVITVGMRGDGDEPMTEDANIALLERIIADQRAIIGEETGRPPEDVPQMWALYKEVQEYYDRGMRVPDDVMLLLCDDNWGNIRKLPKLGDRPRTGGYGVYYHFDYVGGPRNYKWLNTNPLPRIWEQMHLAYESGADRLWVVNVGDVKPMELPIDFLLDYAWDPDAWPAGRLPEYERRWAAEQFGEQHAAEIGVLLAKYAKFNARRKPELLAPNSYHLTNYREAERVVDDFNALVAEAERIGKLLPPEAHDAYFQLVLFPVQACANLNELYVAAGRNRLYAEQGRAAANELAARVDELFARDAELCRQYNEELAGGKWRHMMDQTHIGYTSWQEPRKNKLPRVKRIDLAASAEMAVAVEGSTSWWPGEEGEAVLPAFSPYDALTTRYIEIFNRGRAPFDYSIECNAPWIVIADARGAIETERRVEVSVDWNKAPEGVHDAAITVTGPNDQRVVVHATANKPAADVAERIRGFVEAHGCVAIEAEHFTRAVDAPPIRWQRIRDLGRTLSAVTPFPVTASRQTPGGDAPRLEYRIHLFQSGDVRVQAHVAPTLDFTAGDGRRYAVSIDDAEPQIVNINADDSLQAWERNVGDNINVTETTHAVAAPGEHVLKYWMVDPGVVLERLVVAAGDVPDSYLGPPESVHQTGSTN